MKSEKQNNEDWKLFYDDVECINKHLYVKDTVFNIGDMVLILGGDEFLEAFVEEVNKDCIKVNSVKSKELKDGKYSLTLMGRVYKK